MPPFDELLAKHALTPEHPPEVMAEARQWADDPGIDDPALVDLTHVPFVTIDETTSKDLDQAVFVERSGAGYLVHYAIADASHFVKPGTALYAEALRRGTSLYLPGLVIPMLPRILSEGIVSLNPQVDRRALVWTTAVGADGRTGTTTVRRARVHSHAKLAWGEVQLHFDGGPCPVPGLEAAFDALQAVGESRLAWAEARHVVEYRRKEVTVRTAEGEGRFIAETDERLPVERYNEQISLLTNTVAARFLEHDHPDAHPIYRVHEPPTAERLAALRAHIDALCASHHLDWHWNPDAEPLAAYLRRLPHDGDLGRVAAAIHRAAMRSSGRAGFSPTPGEHHGVGADVYGRFTAPMREIVGVFLHDETVEKLRGAAFPEPHGWGDDEVRDKVIAASERARNLQRDLEEASNRLVLDQLFAEDCRLGRTRRGTVMDITHGKAFVRLDDPSIEVKVYRVHLEADFGERLVPDGVVYRGATTGAARLGVGQAVDVHVVHRDTELDRWRLGITPA